MYVKESIWPKFAKFRQMLDKIRDAEIRIATKHGVCGRVGSMSKINENIAEAAASILKARSIIEGPFKPLTDQIIDQDIKLPLVKLFEVADLHNQALEKLQIELEKLVKH